MIILSLLPIFYLKFIAKKNLEELKKKKMTNQQKDLYERTLIELKNILNSLIKKQCSDKDYMYLCKKLKKMYQKLNQNYPKLNNEKKFSTKKQKVSINEFFADG